MAFALLVRIPKGGGVAPAHGDVPAYLIGAYNIRHNATFNDSARNSPVSPSLGREPGYPLFLAGLMLADPSFGKLDTQCLAADDVCPSQTYRLPSIANLAFVFLTGLVMFIVGSRVTATPLGGLATSAYLLLNTHMNKAWGDLMSDRLAVFLVALCLLALTTLWRKPDMIRAPWVGIAFAALTLVKAIFLPFCILAEGIAAVAIASRARSRPVYAELCALTVIASVYIPLVGGWMARNDEVSGMFRLTDVRSGIALSTRAVFDEMTPTEYAASLVYWSIPNGSKLATRLFGPKTANKFALDQPGGFYDIGQNGYGRRVSNLAKSERLTYWQAVNQIDSQISAGIRNHFAGYLLAMIPLITRGLGIDEFAFIGVSCFAWTLWLACRRRDTLTMLIMFMGTYNIIAYAAFSLNIQRYQMTAMPAIALAVGCVLKELVDYAFARWPGSEER